MFASSLRLPVERKEAPTCASLQEAPKAAGREQNDQSGGGALRDQIEIAGVPHRLAQREIKDDPDNGALERAHAADDDDKEQPDLPIDVEGAARIEIEYGKVID